MRVLSSILEPCVVSKCVLLTTSYILLALSMIRLGLNKLSIYILSRFIEKEGSIKNLILIKPDAIVFNILNRL